MSVARHRRQQAGSGSLRLLPDARLSPTVRSRKASAKPSKKPRLALADCASTTSKTTPVDKSLPSRGGAQSGSNQEDVVWTCNVCRKPIRACNNAVLSWRRANRIVQAHKGTPTSHFHQIQKRAVIVRTAAGRPLDQVSWECAWCSQTLPQCAAARADPRDPVPSSRTTET